MTTDQQIADLHAAYSSMTGFHLLCHTGRVAEWHIWMKRGWNRTDLVLVIRHIQGGIKCGKRNMGALKFSNLVANLDRFEEDLAMARALSRKPIVNANRAGVLEATHRPTEPMPNNIVPIGTLIAGLKNAVGLPLLPPPP
jgi:hypothetical protein